VARIGIDDLGATLAKVTDDAPVICWRTSPTSPVACRRASALQLSGHTHGGQIRLLAGRHRPPSGQRLTYGHIRAKCDVVISAGLGCSIMPVASACRPRSCR